MSDQSYLLVDNAKFGHAALLTYAALDQFQCVVTNQVPDEAFQQYFSEHNIHLVTSLSEKNRQGLRRPSAQQP